MSDESQFLAKLKAAAAANGGKPPGEAQFYRASGLTRKHLWSSGFSSYGAACEAAGLNANRFSVPQISDDDLFRPLAALTRELGRYPPKGALEVARTRDKAFPSWETFKRRERQGPETDLRQALLVWCQGETGFSDVAAILAGHTPTQKKQPTSRQIVNGYVYLMKYGSGGSVYKIGLSDNVPRRHAQINMMTPQDVRVLHTIATDDPSGIESYWFNRFEAKRLEGKKELFRLTAEDVAAFKSRKYQ